jgi:YD repeat-containing protein
VKQYRWRRLITIAVVATLLLGLAALGLGIDALHKIDKINSTVPATSIVAPSGGATISGVVGLDATSIGPKVTAVEFLATGGSYHDAKIATGGGSPVGWVSQWKTTSVRNGTYEITSVGYDAAGQSSRSTSVTVKVLNP